MDFKSLRVKYTLPLIAVISVVIVTYIAQTYLLGKKDDLISDYDKKYTPALSLILNADRDIYQAFVAQQAALSAYDPALENEFTENAQQVLDRFNQFTAIMKGSTEINQYITGFKGVYNQWLSESKEYFALVASQQDKVML